MKTLLLTASLILGSAAIPAAASAQDYPPCSRDMTDKCMQTHEGGGWHATGHMMRHHMHHMRHHMMRHKRHHHG